MIIMIVAAGEGTAAAGCADRATIIGEGERARHPERLAPAFFPSPFLAYFLPSPPFPAVHGTSHSAFPSSFPPSLLLSFPFILSSVPTSGHNRTAKGEKGGAEQYSSFQEKCTALAVVHVPLYLSTDGMEWSPSVPFPLLFHCQRKWSLEMSGGRDEKRTEKGVHGALFLSLLFYSIANCYANVVLNLEEHLMRDPPIE